MRIKMEAPFESDSAKTAPALAAILNL